MRKTYLKKRFLALLIDYMVIWVYLISLFLLFAVIYLVFFDQIPVFNETTSHLMALFTTIVPMTVIFSYMEYNPLMRQSAKGGWDWKWHMKIIHIGTVCCATL